MAKWVGDYFGLRLPLVSDTAPLFAIDHT